MALVRVMCVFPSDTDDSEDVTVNNFGFDAVATPAGLVNAVNALEALYTTLHPVLSPIMNWTNGTYKAYNMGDSPPRVPFDEGNIVVGGTAGVSTLPPECAITVSFQGIAMSGVSQRRRRGRIFLGPLALVAQSAVTGMVDTTRQTLIAGAFQTFWNTSGGSDFTWIILSETPSLNAVVVDNGWVDNAMDTQRRRGRDPLTRTTFGS